MVTIVKHEWHSVDSQFAFELDIDILAEIYPEKDEEELQVILDGVQDGTYDVEDIVNDAWNNDVEIEWERQYDDWWTDRKGGYDITYELGDESSWVEPHKEPEPTHKCTKCRWTGQSYTTGTLYLREDGSIIENYFESDEESHSTKDVCPYCDSDLELTEEGLKRDKATKKLMAELDEELSKENFDEE